MENTNDMYVIKRNGNREELSFDKILNRIRKLGIEAGIHINYQSLVIKVIDQLYNNIIEYCKHNHLSTFFSKKSIGSYFTKLDNIILTKGRHYEDGVYYTFYDIQKIETYLRNQNSSYFNNE